MTTRRNFLGTMLASFAMTTGLGRALLELVDDDPWPTLWICFPHEASDEYVKQLADYFRDHLNTIPIGMYLAEAWNISGDAHAPSAVARDAATNGASSAPTSAVRSDARSADVQGYTQGESM